MRFKMMAAVTLTALTTPAFAQTSGTTEPVPAPKPKKEKKLCRTNELTGTRLGGSQTCHTAAEWAELDKSNNDRSTRGRENGTRR